MSPNRRQVAWGFTSGAVIAQDLATKKVTSSVASGSQVVSIAFSNDGKSLVYASADKTVCVHDFCSVEKQVTDSAVIGGSDEVAQQLPEVLGVSNLPGQSPFAALDINDSDPDLQAEESKKSSQVESKESKEPKPSNLTSVVKYSFSDMRREKKLTQQLDTFVWNKNTLQL
jgi:WD40 repeat protein